MVSWAQGRMKETYLKFNLDGQEQTVEGLQC